MKRYKAQDIFFTNATSYFKIPRKLKKKCKESIRGHFTTKETRIREYTKNFRHSGTSRVTAFSLGYNK